MAEQENQEPQGKKELEISGLEAIELEEEDLEGVAGGLPNNACPVTQNTNCPC